MKQHHRLSYRARRRERHLLIAAGAIGLIAIVAAGCSSMSDAKQLPPLALAPSVDLPRFMGDWYVIANIPTMFEKGAHNAVESYKLADDGTIDTTFSFNAGSFDGNKRSFHSRGFALSDGNAVWGQQYVWPIKADYRISYVAADYSQTVITREKRDYAWIMARSPSMPEADLQRLVKLLGEQGYDVSKIQRVPQQQQQQAQPAG